MRRFFVQFLLFFIGILLFPSVLLAQSVFVSVSDSQAGEVNLVRISGLLGQEEVGVSLVRPDQTKLLFSATADELGVATMKIFGLHLRTAGEYQIKIQRSFDPKDSIIQSFQVLPGKVSAYQSKINIKTASVVADGEAKSFFTLKFRDAYGNFIVGKTVQVFSSRNEDLIVSDIISDEYGEAFGSIKSKTPGVSVISVFVDGVLLFDKPEIIFYLSEAKIENVGASDFGRFLKAQLMSDDLEDDYVKDIEYFSIEDLPSEVVTEKNYTFRVVARDEDGKVAKNYTGKVRFVSSDVQANLPADYTFEKSDQGIHTFALAVMFDEPGQQTFKVRDLDDYSIMANKSLMVVDKNPQSLPDEDAFVEISTPKSGSFKSSRITIIGESSGVEFLKIEDGPVVLVEDLEVETDGTFVFQTPALSDGIHKFRVSNEDASLTSSVVTIEIDQTAPEVMLVEVDPPEGVAAGELFQVKVSSSEALSSSQCVFQEEVVEFEAVGNKFIGSFQAPFQCGEYPISCSISDLLGNERVEPNASVLKVCLGDGEVEDSEDVIENEEVDLPEKKGVSEEEKKNIVPTSISNLSAQSGEGKVTLFWSPAKDDKVVSQYRVEFGKTADSLDQANLVPDNRTQWYVDGLETGETYFFRVVAIDAEKKESVPSNIIEAATLGESLHKAAPKKNPTAGISSWLPFLLSTFVGILFFGIFRKSWN